MFRPNPRLYPLRSHIDKAEDIVKAAAEHYNLSIVQIRGTAKLGRQKDKGGLIYAARLEATRRCVLESVRPMHLALALGLSIRRVRDYYRLLHANGFGPFTMRRAS